MRVCTRLFVAALFLLLNAYPIAAQTSTTALYFDSDPGDPVGRGLERTWRPPTDNLPPTATFVAEVSQDRSRVSIRVTTSERTHFLDFAGRTGVPLATGLYPFATRYDGQTSEFNRLNVTGEGFCSRVIGRFRVYEVIVSSGGTVERFAADFEQHCEGQTPALYGAIRFGAQRSSLVPFDGAYPEYSIQVDPAVNGFVTGPGISCGAGQTDCAESFGDFPTIALAAVPNPGYVFLGWGGFDCEAGSPAVVLINRSRHCTPVFAAEPGSGLPESPNYANASAFLEGPYDPTAPSPSRPRRAFFPPSAFIAPVVATPTFVNMRISPSRTTNDVTTVTFGAPPASVLVPGLYGPAAASSASRGIDPTVSVSGGVSCTQLGGRFVIHEIAFTGELLTRFSADFEVPCSSTQTVSGSIRFNASAASLLPFEGDYPLSTLTVVSTLGGYVTAAGIACGDGGRTDCDEAYAPMTIVSLQAVASPGYELLTWAGGCSGRSPIHTAAMTISRRCVALFHPKVGSASPPAAYGVETLFVDRGAQLLAFSPPNGVLTPTVFSAGSALEFRADSMSGGYSVQFGAPGAPLTAGDYDNAGGSSSSSTRPMISVSSCSTDSGYFKIYEIAFNSAGQLTAFAADFEVYCRSSTVSYIAGAIRYRSSRDVLRPFDGAYPLARLSVARSLYGTVSAPGVICGGAQSDCSENYTTRGTVALQATPLTGYRFIGWLGACTGGSHTTVLIDRTRHCEPLFEASRAGFVQDTRLARGLVLVDSPAGEPIGGGVSQVQLTDSWSVFSQSSRRGLRASAFFDSTWSFEFYAPQGQVLGVGTYEGAVGLNGDPSRPSLYASRVSSCTSANTEGRFVIHELTYSNPTTSTVASLAADFELRCGSAPPLRGSIRYRSSRSEVRPFAGGTVVPTRFDFNGDAQVDLVWQNRTDGRLLFWYLNGTSHSFNEPPSVPSLSDTNWHVVGSADANGDGYQDLYWQHQTNGSLAVWLLRDGQVLSGESLSPSSVADTEWKVRTVVDLDRDGHPDLIWQHRVNGDIAVWFMNGLTVRSGEALGPGRVADTNWTIVGAGDANGDDRPDLYWHHLGTGQLAIWLMDGTRLTGGESISPSSVADTNWRVRGIADLDRNGSADLIWQNVATSELAVWLLNGLRLIDGRHITGPAMPAASWVLVGPR